MVTSLPRSVDVFIVGGGPAGLATAIAARSHGLTVLVADGAVPPIDKPCGEGLMPDGVAALCKLGVSIPEREVFPFRGIRFLNDDTSAEATFPHGTAYGFRRTALHRVMVDRAAEVGVQMRWQAVVTGLHPEGVLVGGEIVRSRWTVGADGTSSRVRRWANMSGRQQPSLRFAFRRHYRIPPWTDFMELYWGRQCQIYVTPVSSQEVCVAMISNSPKLRLEEALMDFPLLARRLGQAEHSSAERGAITVNRSLRSVAGDRTVLVGDASGGVDAITGEGLCLAFQQATVLAGCLASGNLQRYQNEHRRLARRPAMMARLMLLLGKQHGVRRRVMQTFQATPRHFEGMLAMHVGAGSTRDYITNGFDLGWSLLTG